MNRHIWSEQQIQAAYQSADEWLQIGLATDPADLDAVRPAINYLYQEIGQSAPSLIRCPSPLYAEGLITISRNRDRVVHSKLKSSLQKKLVRAEMLNSVTSQFAGIIQQPLYRLLQRMMVQSIRDTVADDLREYTSGLLSASNEQITREYGYGFVEQMEKFLRNRLNDPMEPSILSVQREIAEAQTGRDFDTWFWGSLDSFWIGHYLFPHRHISSSFYSTDIVKMLETFEIIARNSFFFYPLDGTCLVCDRPLYYRFNEQNRLHSTTGPVIEFRDGWKLWYINGVRVPEGIVMHPDQITVAMIQQEANIEVRRLMLDLYGVERFIKDSESHLVNTEVFNGRTYQLWQATLNRDDEDVTMLKVTNATPEVDGSFKDYWLRVPPDVITAMGAVAWTFNLRVDAYRQLMFES